MNKRIYKDEDQLCADIFKTIDDSFLNEKEELNFGFFTSNIKESSEVYEKLCDHFENTEDYSSVDISKRIYTTLDYYYASKRSNYCVEPVLQVMCYFNLLKNSIEVYIQVYSHKDNLIMINPTAVFVNGDLPKNFVSSLVLDKDMDKIAIYSIDPDLYEKGINHMDIKVDTEKSQHKDSSEKSNNNTGATEKLIIDNIEKIDMFDRYSGNLLNSWKIGINTFDYSKQEEKAEENEMNSCECSDCSEKIIHSEEMLVDDLKYLSYSYIDENGEYKTINCSTNDEDFIYYFMDYIHEILNREHEN